MALTQEVMVRKRSKKWIFFKGAKIAVTAQQKKNLFLPVILFVHPRKKYVMEHFN